MTNYTATPQATTYPLVLHTGISTPSKALGSILGRVVSGLVLASATSRNLTPLHPSNLVLSLRPYRQISTRHGSNPSAP